MKALSPKHWIAREFPSFSLFQMIISFILLSLIISSGLDEKKKINAPEFASAEF